MINGTLRQRFPFVNTLGLEFDHPLEVAIKPYLSWNLITMDDYINILITSGTGRLVELVQNDLLIIEGAAAKLWLAKKGLLR